MAIVILILCLVGAVAGAQRPTDNAIFSSPQVSAMEVTTPMLPSAAKSPICDPVHSTYRDLSVPFATQTNDDHIGVCDED